jgi:transposase-like protein
MHRIRFAMADPGPVEPLRGDVEVDGTYVGGKPRPKGKKARQFMSKKKKDKLGRSMPEVHYTKRKAAVMALVERDGRVRTRVMADVTADNLQEVVRQHVDRTSRIMTDEFQPYRGLGKQFEGGHHRVKHSAHEYARGDIHTNTVESFFSLLKRGVYGVYHNISKKHLHRYLAEFEFRWDTRRMEDGARTVRAIRQMEGKRLTYRPVKA